MMTCGIIIARDLFELCQKMDIQPWQNCNWDSPKELLHAWLRNDNGRGVADGRFFIACRVRAGIVWIGYRDPRSKRLGDRRECVAYIWQGVEPLLLELLILKYNVPVHDGIPYAFKKTDKIKPNAGDIPTRKDGSAKQMLSARLSPRRQSKGQSENHTVQKG